MPSTEVLPFIRNTPQNELERNSVLHFVINNIEESACDIFSQRLKHALNIRCLFMLG